MAVIESLLVKLGFTADTTGVQKFSKSLSSVRNQMLAVGAAATAMGVLIFKSAHQFAEASEHLSLNAERAAVTTDAYQELAGAATLAGSSSEGFSSSLQSFASNIGQATIGAGSAIQAFAMMGISINDVNGHVRSTTDLLAEVSDKLQGFSKARQISLAQQLGFSSENIKFLLLGSEKIKELRHEIRETGSVLSKESIAKGEKFNEQLKIMGFVIKGVKDKIQEALIPTVLELSESFSEWFKNNQKIIQQDLSLILNGIAKGLGLVLSVSAKLFKVLSVLAIPIGGVTNLIGLFITAFAVSKLKTAVVWIVNTTKAIFALGRVILAFNFAGAFGAIITGIRAVAAAIFTLNLSLLPIEAIIALFAALGVAIFLIIQDIKVFAEGGDSVLGKLVARFTIVKKVIDAVVESIKFLSRVTSSVKTGLEDAGSILFPSPSAAFAKIKSLSANVTNKLFGSSPEPSASNGGVINNNDNNVSTVNNQASSQSSQITATINVNGADDPQTIAQKITEHLNNAARQSQRDLSNPVQT